MRMKDISAFMVALASLAGCSGPASIGDAEKEIAHFHSQYDAEDYAAILKATSKEMYGNWTEAQFRKLLEAVHRQLGKVVASKQVGWRSNVTTNGSYATVQMQTTFEKGSGGENFVFRKEGAKLELAGYHLNSNDLISN